MTNTVQGQRKTKKIPALFIRSRSARGFRRCGLGFTPQGDRIALSALTAQQIQTLKAEPALIVENGEIDDTEVKGATAR